MNDYILLAHDDATPRALHAEAWTAYLVRLRAAGVFQGGSAIGSGVAASKALGERPITRHLTGYIRVEAANLDEARAWINGHPVYEAGGTVEVRELPKS